MIAGCVTFALWTLGRTWSVEPEGLVPAPPPPAEPAPAEPAPAEEAPPRRGVVEASSTPEPKTSSDSRPPIPPPPIPEESPPGPAPVESTATASQPSATIEGRASRQRSNSSADSSDDPIRRGVVVSGSVGYAGCANAWCAGYNRGVGIGAGVGVRLRNFMPLIAYNGGRGPYSTERLSQEVLAEITNNPKLRNRTLGAGFMVFPVGRGPAKNDPFFGVRLGFASVALDYDMGQVSAAERVLRGAVTLSVGGERFVTRHLAFGLRFDGHIMFRGRNCTTYTVPGASPVRECDSAEDRESRTDPRDWPFPFNVGVQMRYVWRPSVFGAVQPRSKIGDPRR